MEHESLNLKVTEKCYKVKVNLIRHTKPPSQIPRVGPPTPCNPFAISVIMLQRGGRKDTLPGNVSTLVSTYKLHVRDDKAGNPAFQ